jgi:hypothetical protein
VELLHIVILAVLKSITCGVTTHSVRLDAKSDGMESSKDDKQSSKNDHNSISMEKDALVPLEHSLKS